MSKQLKVGIIENPPTKVKETIIKALESNDPDYQIVLDTEPYEETRKRVCCNCGNNIRVKNDKGMVVENRCAIDNHYIGYTECFEHWCNRWRKNRSWEKDKKK